MRRPLITLLLLFTFSLSFAEQSQANRHALSRVVASANSYSLPRSTPERQGISSSAILDFVEAADKQIDTMNSFMLIRHGYVVAEGWWDPYDAATPHILYSLSKSFTSTAVGLAISEGKMSLDDEVLKFFPDDAPAEPSAKLEGDARARPFADGYGQSDRSAQFELDGVPWTQDVSGSSGSFQTGHALSLQLAGYVHALRDRAESDRHDRVGLSQAEIV